METSRVTVFHSERFYARGSKPKQGCNEHTSQGPMTKRGANTGNHINRKGEISVYRNDKKTTGIQGGSDHLTQGPEKAHRGGNTSHQNKPTTPLVFFQLSQHTQLVTIQCTFQGLSIQMLYLLPYTTNTPPTVILKMSWQQYIYGNILQVLTSYFP